MRDHDLTLVGDAQWVAIDVAAEALNISKRRAYELARQDHWRCTRRRPKQYLFADIRNTYSERKNTR